MPNWAAMGTSLASPPEHPPKGPLSSQEKPWVATKIRLTLTLTLTLTLIQAWKRAQCQALLYPPTVVQLSPARSGSRGAPSPALLEVLWAQGTGALPKHMLTEPPVFHQQQFSSGHPPIRAPPARGTPIGEALLARGKLLLAENWYRQPCNRPPASSAGPMGPSAAPAV
ncbi:hypothetical protein QTO34_016815 [Cnephaeus nilssonii]|uniref:Uncharacterized protein n=1 Tax=Cnephaeus nilssonii TaxID=3371016 RepID=A0AA40LS70_CNENI|nr:hypothetical protein QTO34_016815 [Eptesicus nilssonii]